MHLASLDPFQTDLQAIHPSLQLRVSLRARRLALRLDARTGRINLVVPKRASLTKALDFARKNQDWVVRQANNRPEKISVENGAVLPVLGRDRLVRIDYDDEVRRTVVTLTETELQVSTNLDDPRPRITRYLKALARDEITRRAHEKAATVDRKINAIKIRDTTSRWGSCSPDGNLSFSWRLILAPEIALDYVVAHEVAHLVHLDHKTRFWALCEKLSADFDGGHGWMKKNAHLLMRYQ